jgi:uncharacterized spore protein YtfJ
MQDPSGVQRMIEQARDTMTVRRVFGDPYEKNGVTVIPAARAAVGAKALRDRAPVPAAASA